MKMTVRDANDVARAVAWGEGVPLMSVVPTHDEYGNPLSDFMMLATGLNKRPPKEIEAALAVVHGVLTEFGEWVVFADFNMKLNLLWISHRQRPGLMSQIAGAMHARLPMFKLVGHLTKRGK